MLQASLAYRTIDTGEKDIWSQGGSARGRCSSYHVQVEHSIRSDNVKITQMPHVQLLLESKV